jgi:hypothetical protein
MEMLPDAPGDVTEIVPEYVPAVRPAGFTLTPKLPGVAPFCGDTLNHERPVPVEAENVRVVLVLLASVTY